MEGEGDDGRGEDQEAKEQGRRRGSRVLKVEGLVT